MKNALSNVERVSVTTFSNELGSATGDLAADANSWSLVFDDAMPREWADLEYRHAAMEAHVEHLVAWQCLINREERGWSQAEMAVRMGTKQSAISKLEKGGSTSMRVSTLVKAAHAFDCAVLVKFVSYAVLAAETSDLRSERLYACSFQEGDYGAARVKGRRTAAAVK